MPKGGEEALSPWQSFSTGNSTWQDKDTGAGSGRLWQQAACKIWYPADGVRYAQNGVIQETSAIGYAWSSTCSGTLTYRLHFDNSAVLPARVEYGYRAHGFPVRCIRE